MSVWPFLMAITAILTAWGWRHNAWEIPALALLGYILMRGVVTYVPADFVEVVGCALWLMIAAGMLYKGGAFSGMFYTLSALTYPVFLIFGFRITYMGWSPIIADSFAILALLSIGGGIYGAAHSGTNTSGPLVREQALADGLSEGTTARTSDHS